MTYAATRVGITPTCHNWYHLRHYAGQCDTSPNEDCSAAHGYDNPAHGYDSPAHGYQQTTNTYRRAPDPYSSARHGHDLLRCDERQ